MKNFDSSRKARQKTEEERTFALGGHTFVAKKGVHPSALAAYDGIGDDTGVGETLEIVDDLILAMVEDRDGAHGRYLDLRADQDDPLTIEDLLELVKWLVEIQTGRPTGQPGDSSPGLTSTPTPSTAG